MIKKSNIRFIDLNLPSKILWGNKNFIKNKYYAWGELKGYSENQIESGLKIFDDEHYKFYKNDKITKYNDSDKLLELQPEDDVVTMTLGENYRIPREEDFEELLEYTKRIYTENFVIFKSKTNKNQIIFPLLGYAYKDSVSTTLFSDSYCDLWSSSLSLKETVSNTWILTQPSSIDDAWTLGLNGTEEKCYIFRNDRCYGAVIRPIKFKI